MCMRPPDRTGSGHIYLEELIVNLKITGKIGDHQAITFSIKIEKGNIASEKTATTLEEQILCNAD